MNPGRNVSSIAPDVDTIRHCDDSDDPKTMTESRPHQTMLEAVWKTLESSFTWQSWLNELRWVLLKKRERYL